MSAVHASLGQEFDSAKIRAAPFGVLIDEEGSDRF